MIQLHATTVALSGRAVLILGPSGAGKSSLALELMAAGASLVADDRTDLRREGETLIAAAPRELAGRIEARGIGILSVEHLAEARVNLVCDLGQPEAERLPPFRNTIIEDVTLPLVLGPYRPHLYAALRQLLLGQRLA